MVKTAFAAIRRASARDVKNLQCPMAVVIASSALRAPIMIPGLKSVWIVESTALNAPTSKIATDVTRHFSSTDLESALVQKTLQKRTGFVRSVLTS